jgi:hypothetical protein
MNIFKQISANNITLEEFRFLKELAMEAYLIENQNILKLDNYEFNDVEIIDAEIALKEGRKSHSKNGRIDILAKYGSEYLGIVELKLEELQENHLLQLEDYLSERLQLIEKYPEFWNKEDGDAEPKWLGVLVGNFAERGLIDKIQNGYKYNGQIPIALILLNRFRNPQNGEIFVISDTHFKSSSSAKDYSKFLLNGTFYNKGRLVNAVIKEYVSLKPEITFAELEHDFPKRIQGSFGVFTQKEEAEKIFIRSNRTRHHIKPNELIHLSDCTIATCSQWNTSNIKEFIKQTGKLTDKIRIEII